MALFNFDLFGGFERIRFFFPPGNLLDAALRIFIQWNSKFLDEVFTAFLDKIWRVLGEMFGTLGDKVTETGEHFITHFVGAARIPMAGLGEAAVTVSGEKIGIEVPMGAVVQALLEREIEGHMIDAGGTVADFFDRNIEVAGQFKGSALHRVAEADLADFRELG